MFTRKLAGAQGLMLATIFSLVPAPAIAQPVITQAADARLEFTISTGGSQPRVITQDVPAGGSVTMLAKPTQVQSFATSGRYLVRLKDQPLQPFVRQFKTQALAAGTTQVGVQAQLLNASIQQKQRIQSAQAQLISDARNRKLVTQVHHQFRELTNSLSVTLAPDALEAMRKLPQVAAVYPDNEVKVSLTDSVPTTHAPQVWAMQDALGNAITGKGIKVAILDTGIDYTQPDLGGCVGPGCKVVAGQSFVTGAASTDFMDRHGHGSHVAGIVAASGTLKGVAPDASLYAYKVLNDQGSGFDSNIIAGLEKAVNPDGDPATDDGVDVINMSLGGYGLPDSPLTEAANAAMGAGALVVVAAGNSGSNYGTIGSPGNGERVLTVGAINNLGEMADFSSRGPVAGKNYVKPEIVAPGVNINSVKAGGGYTVMSGTSMATPHVAGGAALVLQARPGLSPDELKSLLISSARDLGHDVFSQGAGAMDLQAAVLADVLVTMPLQGLGFVDTSVPFWNAPAKLTVKNLSKAVVDLSLGAPATPLAGMNINLPVSYQKALGAGEQTDIDYAVIVDNELLPYSTRASFHHENAFTLNAGQRSLHIPVALVKAAQLTVNAGNNLLYLMLISVDNSTSEFKHSGCAPDSTGATFNLRPGKYHLVTSYCGSDNPFVFKENLELKGSQTLTISEAEATLKVGVDKVITSDGKTLSGSLFNSWISPLSWYHADAQAGVYTGYTSVKNIIMRTNPVSSAFKLRGALLLQDLSQSPVKDTYLQNFAFDEGISSDYLVTLNASDMHKLDFHYDDAAMVEKGIAFSYRMSENRSVSKSYAMGFGLISNLPRYTPIHASLYAPPSSFNDGEFYPELDVGLIEPTSYGLDNRSIMHSSYLAFPSKDEYRKLPGLFFDWLKPGFSSTSKRLEVLDNGYFNNSSFNYYFWQKSISLINPQNWVSNAMELHDEQENMFLDSSTYLAFCDGKNVAEGKTSDSDFYTKMASQTCDQISYEISYPQRFMGKESSSLMQVVLNTKDDGTRYMASSPMLEQLVFADAGQPSRILHSDNPTVTLVARDPATGLVYQPAAVSLQYKLDGATDWDTLATELQSDKLVAKLPVLDGQHEGSLRISLDDGKGSRLQHTMNGIFLLGKAAMRPVSPPVFASLPRLVKEATANLTPYEFPVVNASDRQDGAIIATTTARGPFAVGSHEIIWTATNQAGMVATATQTLLIVDTTPPTVLAPAAIEMTATGATTAVNLGMAQAFDIVDGVFDAIPDQPGPFAVGTNTVIWRAVDKAGNMGSATQKVVIKASSSSSSSPSQSMSSSSSSSAASSTATIGGGSTPGTTAKSGGGGGGAADKLLLLLLAATVLGQVFIKMFNLKKTYRS